MAGKLLTVKEVAARLTISESSVYRLLKAGDLPSIKIGGALRFDEQDVEAYIERCKATDQGGSSSRS